MQEKCEYEEEVDAYWNLALRMMKKGRMNEGRIKVEEWKGKVVRIRVWM